MEWCVEAITSLEDKEADMSRLKQRYLIIKNKLYIKIGIKYDLVVVDDLFPHPVSAFRNAEIINYLLAFPRSKVICTGSSYRIIGSNNELDDDISRIELEYPSIKGRVVRECRINFIRAKHLYCIFYNNLKRYIYPLSERFNIPFTFTLYPGGGFDLENSSKKSFLVNIINKSRCKGVIVNQKVTRDYLINAGIADIGKIKYIPGSPVLDHSLTQRTSRSYFKNDVINVGFIAGKYSDSGLDKGFDIFVGIVQRFSKDKRIKFHLAGGFTSDDIPEYKEVINIYGYLSNEDLEILFKEIDIVISPNRPFILCEGCFDGFPLTTVAQAGLNGVCIICSDQLNENELFVNEKEILITKPMLDNYISNISKLLERKDLIVSIGEIGQKKFIELYSRRQQIDQRVEFMENRINK